MRMRKVRSGGRSQAIAAAAERAFYRDGFGQVGMDRVTAEAGVALGTLYRHFNGRSDLVVGALAHREARFFAALEAAAEGLAGEARVLSLFNALERWAQREGGNGCFFLRAAAAHPQDGAVQAAAFGHKRAYLELIRRRLLEGGWSAAAAGRLAPGLFLLLEGAVASAGLLGDAGAELEAVSMARRLLRDDPPGDGRQPTL